jgi:hypothetical protein
VERRLVTANLALFDFRGDALDVARFPDGDVGVTVRALSAAIGLDADGQLNRLARAAAQGARWATTSIMEAVAADGRVRPMAFLPRRSIPMWAATVDASRCAPEVQAKLVAYQDDAAEALARAFLPGESPAGRSPVLSPAVAGEGARLLRLAADALDAGTGEDARRYQSAAFMLIRGPRQPPRPRAKPRALEPEPAPKGKPLRQEIRARMREEALAILARGRVLGGRTALADRMHGHAGHRRITVAELIAEGRIAATWEDGRAVVRLVAASAEVH